MSENAKISEFLTEFCSKFQISLAKLFPGTQLIEHKQITILSSEFTICTIIKSDIRIGTIFSYVTQTTEDGFKEEIILEKHKVTGKRIKKNFQNRV